LPSDDDVDAILDEAEAVLAGNGISGIRSHLNQRERLEIRRLRVFLKQQDEELATLRSAVEALEIAQEAAEPKAARIPKRKGKRRLSAIFCSSDTHWRELIDLPINQHNPTIGHERIRACHDQMIASLKRKSKDAELVHLTYWQGGDDLVNGDMHDGLLSAFVDETPLEEMELTYNMRHQEHRHLQAKLDVPVRVVVSVSNHDRDTPQMQAGLAARRSYDIAISHRLARDYAEWDWHIEPSYYAVSQVGEFRTAFHHGHAKKANVKTTACGLRTPPWRWLSEMQQHHYFKLWVQGHRHTDSFMRTSSMAFSENGCTCGPNGYAYDSGFAPEPPSQSLIYIDHETNTVESRETLFA